MGVYWIWIEIKKDYLMWFFESWEGVWYIGLSGNIFFGGMVFFFLNMFMEKECKGLYGWF